MDTVVAILIGVVILAQTSAIFLGSRCRYWRKRAAALETEANEAADKVVTTGKLIDSQSFALSEVAQKLFEVTIQSNNKDETIASLTAERDAFGRERERFASDTREANHALRRWAIRNPSRPIRDLNDLVEKAFVSGSSGRLTRLVPKEPTNG